MTLLTTTYKYFESIFLDFCIICKTSSRGYLCDDCKSTFFQRYKPLSLDPNTIWDSRITEQSFSAFSYNKAIEFILERAKNEGYHRVLKTLGMLLAAKYIEEFKLSRYEQKKVLILPVPISESKKRKRGFNQSEIIAIGFMKKMNSMFENYELSTAVLQRNGGEIKIDSQVGKNKLARQNIYLEFCLTSETLDILGKFDRILILDDVYTTGTTINSCLDLFIDKDVKKKVGYITFTRA